MAKKSKVWKYFEKNIKEPGVVKCTLCTKVLKYDGSTSSMLKHINSLHNKDGLLDIGKKIKQ
jgi:hypothetical protein